MSSRSQPNRDNRPARHLRRKDKLGPHDKGTSLPKYRIVSWAIIISLALLFIIWFSQKDDEGTFCLFAAWLVSAGLGLWLFVAPRAFLGCIRSNMSHIRQALMDITSRTQHAQRRGTVRLVFHTGRKAPAYLDALRQEGIAVPDIAPQKVSRRSRYTETWNSFPLAYRAVAMAISVAMCWYLAITSLLGDMFIKHYIIAVVALGVCTAIIVFLSALLVSKGYKPHRERELIWQLNSSKRSERMDAAKKLALYGGTEALRELFEVMQEDDAELVAAARCSHAIVKMFTEDNAPPATRARHARSKSTDVSEQE